MITDFNILIYLIMIFNLRRENNFCFIVGNYLTNRLYHRNNIHVQANIKNLPQSKQTNTYRILSYPSTNSLGFLRVKVLFFKF